MLLFFLPSASHEFDFLYSCSRFFLQGTVRQTQVSSELKYLFTFCLTKQSFHDASLTKKGLKHLQCCSKTLGSSFTQGIEFFTEIARKYVANFVRRFVLLPEQENSISELRYQYTPKLTSLFFPFSDRSLYCNLSFY